MCNQQLYAVLIQWHTCPSVPDACTPPSIWISQGQYTSMPQRGSLFCDAVAIKDHIPPLQGH